jgi:hypothetical protein
MPQQPKPQSPTNGQRPASSGPNDRLDIYQEAIESTVDDELLDEVLLGLGNYEESEYWQQVESFRSGLFASEAFTRRIRERAIQDTKQRIAKEGIEWVEDRGDGVAVDRSLHGWRQLPADERERFDRRRWLDKRAEYVWEQLPERVRINEIVDRLGAQPEWTPPHWRMMMMRHEASRSKGARLMDNLFGRVDEVHDNRGSDGDGLLGKMRGENK